MKKTNFNIIDHKRININKNSLKRKKITLKSESNRNSL